MLGLLITLTPIILFLNTMQITDAPTDKRKENYTLNMIRTLYSNTPCQAGA